MNGGSNNVICRSNCGGKQLPGSRCPPTHFLRPTAGPSSTESVPTMAESPQGLRNKLTVFSANVRSLLTNTGDATNSFILKHSADIAVATEAGLIMRPNPLLEGSEVTPSWSGETSLGELVKALLYALENSGPAFTGRSTYRDGSTVLPSSTAGWYRNTVVCLLVYHLSKSWFYGIPH